MDETHHKEYEKTKSMECIEKALEEFAEDEIERTNFLHEFIDDFVQSEEYKQYLMKRNALKKDKAVQYNIADTKIHPKPPSMRSKHELTARSKRIHLFDVQLQKYLDDEKNLEIVRKQEKGIEAIRRKIAEFKEMSSQIYNDKLEKIETLKKEILKQYCDKLNLNCEQLRSSKAKKAVVNKILYYKKLTKNRRKRREMNYLKIICKLSNELSYKKIPEKKKIKRKPIKSIESSNELSDNEYEDLEIVETENSEKVNEEDETKTIILHKRNVTKSKCANRTTSSEIRISSLFEQFEQFDEILEDRRIISSYTQVTEISLPECNNLRSYPDEVIFENIESGKRYRKTFSIYNTSTDIYKIRFIRFDILASSTFQIQPLPEIVKLFPGIYVKYSLIFEPNSNTSLRGCLEFVVYSLKESNFESFKIKLCCLEKFVELNMPSVIDFGCMHYWMAELNPFKSIKFSNKGRRECDLILTKSKNDDDFNEKSNAVGVMEPILEQLLDNIFDSFRLESKEVHLNSNDDVSIKIYLQNVDHVGDYFQIYNVDIYDEKLIGRENIFVKAEVIDNSLQLESNILDFGVCCFDSLYQIGLSVRNDSNGVNSVYVKLPSSLVDYVKCDISSLYIPAKATKQILFKLLPRFGLMKSNYFDVGTSLLKFSVYVHVANRTDIPPLKAIALAVLSQKLTLTIEPSDTIYYNKVNVYDLTYAYIKITNVSLHVEIFGIINIPEGLTVLPHFGFDKLKPGESKTYKMYFHPGIKNVNATNPFVEHDISYALRLETLPNIGRLKDVIDGRKFKNFASNVIKELQKPTDLILKDLIEDCKSTVRSSLVNNKDCSKLERGSRSSSKCDEIQRLPLIILCQATVTQPMLKLSSNEIYLGNICYGSYGYSEFKIMAFKDANLGKYEAFFWIKSDISDVKIEPNCGILQPGDVKKLYVVVKLNKPEEIVEYKRNLSQDESNEIFLWRDLKTYKTKVKFTCCITYSNLNLNKHHDKIYLNVGYVNVPPEFIIISHLSLVNFNFVCVGAKSTETVVIQNISYETIPIKLDVLNPSGPFRIPFMKNLNIPPEHFLMLPIRFQPEDEVKYEEYFEISSKVNKVTLMMTGIGIKPDITFNLKNNVYRFEISPRKLLKFRVGIKNNTDSDVNVKFEKIVELEGTIDLPLIEDKKKKQNRMNRKQNVFLSACNDELHDLEAEQIKKKFKKMKGWSFFNISHECKNVKKNSSEDVFIYFGSEALLKDVQDKHLKNDKIFENYHATGKIKLKEEKLYYVTKYVITLDNSFLRDIILIGSFKQK